LSRRSVPAQLRKQPGRRAAGDGVEVRDQVCLVVVARIGGDHGPCGGIRALRQPDGGPEPLEPGVGLGADAQCTAQHAAQVAFQFTVACGGYRAPHGHSVDRCDRKSGKQARQAAGEGRACGACHGARHEPRREAGRPGHRPRGRRPDAARHPGYGGAGRRCRGALRGVLPWRHARTGACDQPPGHAASGGGGAQGGRGTLRVHQHRLVYGPNGGAVASEDDACAPVDAYPLSKLAAERMLLAIEGLDVRILRLPFVYGDGDPHIGEVVPLMRAFPPAQRMSIAHHADVAQAVSRLLAAPAPAHRIYNVTDDEAPDLAALFAAVGQPPPDGSDPERARAFAAVLDGRRLRDDLGFRPLFPRLADAVAAGQA